MDIKAQFVHSALAGTFAGALGIFVGHPFDSLKTRIQVGKKLTKDEIGLTLLRNLYRGLLPPLCTAGIMQSINFSLYETARKLIYTPMKHYYQVDVISPTQNPNLHLTAVFIGACCSGTVVSLLGRYAFIIYYSSFVFFFFLSS
jgi:Mitochondrial carrier protein